MARKVQVTLVDDIDGGTADETLSFGLDGFQYEIDLSGKNAEKLRKALAEFVGAARKVGRGNVVSIQRGYKGQSDKFRNQPNRDRDLNNQIRKWANDNGYGVAERGRIPQQVVAAYEANDPTMLPGYQAPQAVEVKEVKMNLSEGGTAVKTAKKVPAQKKTPPAKAAVAAAG